MSKPDQRLRTLGRLVRRADFQRVYAKGKRIRNRLFVAYVLRRSEGPLRLGVVASRRVGGAVERNRAKRLLREVFRRNRPAAGVAGDVVLIAEPTISGARYGELEKAYVGTVGRTLE